MMKAEIEDAMRHLDIFVDNETMYNETNIKDALMSTPKHEMRPKTKDIIVLLKNLPTSVFGNVFYVDKEKDDIFHEAMRNISYEEETDTIEFVIRGYKSNVHRLFYKSFQEVFKKSEPLEEMDTLINLEYLMIPSDFSRTKFDGCQIAMKTVSESSFEVKLSGSSSILILVFYLDRVIKSFLKKCKKQNMWSGLYYCSPSQSSISSVEEDDNAKNLSDDTLPEVERRFCHYSSTPADAEVEVENSLHSSLSSSPEGPIELCVDCALISSSLNSSNLTSAKYEVEIDCCKTLCLEYTDSLAIFTEAFCSKIVEKDNFHKDVVMNLKKNLKILFDKVFDHLPNGRMVFYCKVLEYMEFLENNDDKDKVITLMNEIANLFVEVPVKDFENNLGGRIGRSARKSLFRYLGETSNFLSLQAVVETMLIFYKNGININIFLPESLSFLSLHFANIPTNFNSIDYHHKISNITRKIILEVLKESSIEVHELRNEQFMNQIVPSGRDLFLYFKKKENVLCHLVVFSPKKVYLEQFKLESVVFDDEAGTLATDHWNFTFKYKQSLSKLMGITNTLSSGETKVKQSPFQVLQSEAFDEENDANVNTDENKKDKETEYVQSNIEEKEEMKEDTLSDMIPSSTDANNSDDRNDEDMITADKDDSIEEQGEEENEGEEGTIAAVVKSKFRVNQKDIAEYWNQNRSFYRSTTGRDWPMMYGCPCAVVMKYDRVKVVDSRKRNLAFARLRGKCTICPSQHEYRIKKSPFCETLMPDGSIHYEAIMDMIVCVSVQGRFHVTDSKPNIKKPVHSKENAKGLDLRGEERRLLGIKASLEGAAPVYREGMAYAQRHQIENSNRTSIRSLPVIRGAMAEHEKKMHGGDDFNKSIRNVMDSQQNSYSKNFPKVKKLPGIVRSFQEKPFKMTLGNYDQLRIGSEYLNKTENSFLCIDSSGKFWAERQKKNEPKKLNSALVIPPVERGQSPFPIFEQISTSNKTIDFLGFFQYAWHHMSASINNGEVKFPTVIITDISFANIHSILQFFNQLKIKDYLKIAYTALVNKVKVPVATVVTICESHLIPAVLKSVRGAFKDKVVADTLVAGVMVMLQAKDLQTAYDIWKNLVKIHCSKISDKEAQKNVKTHSYEKTDNESYEDRLMDFENENEEPEEVTKYGKREAIRANSPFLTLFMKIIQKIENEEANIEDVSNPFYCPNLVRLICKQYLSLFPLISASVFTGGAVGLRNNAYVELYWQELRRIFSTIPKRILWPPQYLGLLHEEMQRKATEIIVRKFIPNIRTGGKVQKKALSFVDKLDVDDDPFNPGPPAKKKKEIFQPKPSKKEKKDSKPKESFNESFETWDKNPKQGKKKNNTYMKNKIIDYTQIEEDNLKGKQKKIVVKGPGAASGKHPQGIEISEERLAAVLTKNVWIDNEIVDAAMSLVDRKLSEDCKYVEGVTIYNNTILRLISTGDKTLLKDGPFISIFPRKFAIAEETAQALAIGRGEELTDLDIGHFTLISNINCGPNEVNVFETLPAYRRNSNLLTEEQKTLLKILMKSEKRNLKVNCVNVCPQKEHECGAISLGLCIKLCFTAPDERAIFESFIDARRDFAECLRLNDLINFESKRVENRLDSNDVLFSFYI